MGSFFVACLSLRILIFTQLVLPNNFENTFKIMMIFSSYGFIIKAFERYYKLVYHSGIIILTFFSSIMFFSLYFRIRFKNIDMSIYDDELIYDFSFKTYPRAVLTMISTAFGANFPDLPIIIGERCTISLVVFWVFIFFNSIILLSIIMGVFYFIYMEIFIKNYEFVVEKYPDYEKKIGSIMRSKFTEYSLLNNLVESYLNDDDFYNEENLKKKIKKIRGINKF